MDDRKKVRSSEGLDARNQFKLQLSHTVLPHSCMRVACLVRRNVRNLWSGRTVQNVGGSVHLDGDACGSVGQNVTKISNAALDCWTVVDIRWTDLAPAGSKLEGSKATHVLTSTSTTSSMCSSVCAQRFSLSNQLVVQNCTPVGKAQSVLPSSIWPADVGSAGCHTPKAHAVVVSLSSKDSFVQEASPRPSGILMSFWTVPVVPVTPAICLPQDKGRARKSNRSYSPFVRHI
jgi:hypothetical protein